MIGAATVALVVVAKGRFVVGTIHQLKVSLRDVHPVVWRRIHVPSMANLLDLHNVIQFAMGWDNEHLHLFVKGWDEYGDNAGSEDDVTLAGLLPQVGGRLAYRYDFGDCWDHDIEVEKVHQAAKNVTYPRCTAGGRACPSEDCGNPDGFVESLRALRHRKGWEYQRARHLFGSGTWDGAAWDKDAVSIGGVLPADLPTGVSRDQNLLDEVVQPVQIDVRQDRRPERGVDFRWMRPSIKLQNGEGGRGYGRRSRRA